MVDALPVPWLAARFGRRRGWLIASQLALIAAILFLGTRDPIAGPFALDVQFGDLIDLILFDTADPNVGEIIEIPEP